MPRFFSRVLQALDDIYGVIGGQPSAPTNLDTTSPVSLVHDVSRLAGIASGGGAFDGIYHVGATLTVPGGGGTIESEFSLYGDAAGGVNWEVDYRNEWVWILRAWSSVLADGNQGNFTSSAWYVFNQTLQGIGPGSTTAIQPELIYFGDTDIAASQLRPAAGWRGVRGPFPLRRPMLAMPLPASSPNCEFVVFGADACTVNGGLLIWKGPQGILPPGVA